MGDTWSTIPVAEIKVGDRIRLPQGGELLVSRIDESFMGMDALVALIEDTPERWYKQPMPKTGEVEVQRTV